MKFCRVLRYIAFIVGAFFVLASLFRFIAMGQCDVSTTEGLVKQGELLKEGLGLLGIAFACLLLGFALIEIIKRFDYLSWQNEELKEAVEELSKETVTFADMEEALTLTYHGFRYRIDGEDEEKGAVILAYEGKDSEVIIPSSMQGVPVVGIDHDAFFNNDVITAVSIPEGVLFIGAYCFRDCNNLQSVSLPTSLKELGKGVFASDKAITEILLPPFLETIGMQCFYDCDGLTEIKIPESVVDMGGFVFAGCPKELVLLYEGKEIPKSWSRLWNKTNLEVRFLKQEEPNEEQLDQ